MRLFVVFILIAILFISGCTEKQPAREINLLKKCEAILNVTEQTLGYKFSISEWSNEYMCSLDGVDSEKEVETVSIFIDLKPCVQKKWSEFKKEKTITWNQKEKIGEPLSGTANYMYTLPDLVGRRASLHLQTTDSCIYSIRIRTKFGTIDDRKLTILSKLGSRIVPLLTNQ